MSLFTRWQSRSSDPDIRKLAAARLGMTGGAKAAAQLAPMLDDPDPGVRLAVVEALGQTGHAAAIPPLLAAIRAAAGLPDATAAPLGAAIVTALGRVGRHAVPALLEALKGKDQRAREAVVEALGGLESPEALPALKSALGDDRSSVRQAAARGLGRAAWPEAAAALVNAATHRDTATRRAVVEALARVGDAPGAVAALSSALGDSDRAVRAEALRSLGRISSDEAFGAVLAACQSPDRDLRHAARELVKGSAWQPRDARDRAEVAVVRGDFAGAAAMGAAAVEPLVASFDDRDPAVRRAAAEALTHTRDPGAARALAGALADRDESVRKAAARTLARLGPAAAGPVIDRLDDESPGIAASAKAILREMGESAVVGYLMTAMPGTTSARDERSRLVPVGSTEDIDRARGVLVTLECAMTHLVGRLDPKTLAAAASMYDIVRLETTDLRGHDMTEAVEERVSLAAVRRVATMELRRRGLEAPAG